MKRPPDGVHPMGMRLDPTGLRRSLVLPAALLLTLAALACDNGSSYSAPPTAPPAPTPMPMPAPEPQPATARYSVTFDATWSADTHPTDFPSNAHFTRLVGSTHRDGAAFWAPGGIASQGVEDMAERGRTSPLDSIIEGQIANGHAEHLLLGDFVTSPGSTSFEFEASQEHSRVSLVSMVAPSPDWFVGVQGIDLFAGDVWAVEVAVDLYPWDAGTDGGGTYTSPNFDMVPQDPISELTGPPVEWDGGVAPMGTFTFTRIDG